MTDTPVRRPARFAADPQGAGTDPRAVDHRRTIADLRASGVRVTGARRAVIAALHGSPGHPTAEQLAAAAPDTDLSSVYRTLDMLVSLGTVQQVQPPQGPAAYHLLHDGAAHPHAQCLDCGAVLDLPRAPLRGLSEELDKSMGFLVALSGVTLVGRCATCLAVGPG